MNLMEKIAAELKSAMLQRDGFKTTTLRGLKSAILNEEIARKAREKGLDEAEILAVIQKQVKQRDDAAEIYAAAGDAARAEKEIREKEILAEFLPAQMSDDELREMISEIIAENNFTEKDFGKIIGETKKRAGGATTGDKIANVLKREFSK